MVKVGDRFRIAKPHFSWGQGMHRYIGETHEVTRVIGTVTVELGDLGEEVAHGFRWWWRLEGLEPAPTMVDCYCTKHKVSAAALAADRYAAHNAWVLDEGRESFAATIGDVGIRKSKPVYVAQVDEQFGEEF